VQNKTNNPANNSKIHNSTNKYRNVQKNTNKYRKVPKKTANTNSIKNKQYKNIQK